MFQPYHLINTRVYLSDFYLRDSIVVVVGDALTSIFGGVVIFSFIGYMAHILGVPVDKVATQGNNIDKSYCPTRAN